MRGLTGSIASPEVFSFIYQLIMEDASVKKHYTPFTDFLASSRVHCRGVARG